MGRGPWRRKGSRTGAERLRAPAARAALATTAEPRSSVQRHRTMRSTAPNDAATVRCCNDGMNHELPSLFVSHGSPMIALEPGDAGAFMQRLGPRFDATFGRPRAIVSVSAHTAA